MNMKLDEKIGECEVCDKTMVRLTLHYGNMWFCDSCWATEQKATEEHQSPANQQARVDALEEKNVSINSALREAQKIDNGIQVRTDLFNAATKSIISLKEEIDADASIPTDQKAYKLAETLKGRFEHFKSVVFELNQKTIEAGNNQKAIQVYLNQLANQLRQEERDKLKIQDINYKPTPTVKVKAIKTSQTGKGKIDKAELRKYAAELGVGEIVLQMLVVQKGISVEEAANMLRRNIKEAQSMARPD